MKVFKGMSGIKLSINMQEDISEAENIKLVVTRPDRKAVEWGNCVVANQQYIERVLEAQDIDVAGVYEISPRFSISGQQLVGESVFLLVL